MQDQLSFFEILSGLTKEQLKYQTKVISDCTLCVYCRALCCVLNSYRLYPVYIMLSVVCLMYLVIDIFYVLRCVLNVCTL